MNNAKYRIELIVLDLVERMTEFTYVKIARDGVTLFLGYYTKIFAHCPAPFLLAICAAVE